MRQSNSGLKAGVFPKKDAAICLEFLLIENMNGVIVVEIILVFGDAVFYAGTRAGLPARDRNHSLSARIS